MGDNASKANLEGLPGHICDRGRPCNLITQACDEAALSGNIVESSQLYDRANLILAECKKAAPISALNTAIDQFREALDQRPAPHPLRSNSLKNLAAALVSRFSHTNRREDLDDALFLLCDKMQHQWQDVLQRMTGTKDQSRFDGESSTEYDSMFSVSWDNSEASKLSELAKATLTNFNQAALLSSLDTAVALHRAALLCRPNPHPNRLASLSSLAAALHARYRHTNHMPNLDEAILLLREAVSMCADSETSRPNLLANLSAVLATKFDKTDQLPELLEATTLVVQAAGTADGRDDGEATELFRFANVLYELFEQSGQATNIQTAISLMRQGLQLLPADHPNQLPAIKNLANMLNKQFEQSGQRGVLDEEISLRQKVLGLLPAPHPDRSSALNNLACGLFIRFKLSSQREDVDEAISLHREALGLHSAPHPDRSSSLNNLASALGARFDLSGQREDLDEAVSLHRDALGLRPVPHLNRSSALNNLASALVARFNQSGQHKDLDEAICLHWEALGLRPVPSPDRSSTLNNLASALHIRFIQSGQHKDLDEAISRHEEALGLLPAHLPDRSIALSGLANALGSRFYHTSQGDDLDKAISLHWEALGLLPDPHPDRSSSLNNLAGWLHARFSQSGQREDLDMAISLHREVLGVLPAPHPHRSIPLNNLGGGLYTRFKQSGQREDLEEAISLHREALMLLLAPHPGRPSSLSNLANALGARFNQSGQRENLDEAISLYREALVLVPTPHPLRSAILNNLASTLNTLFSTSGQWNDLDEAINVFYQSLDAIGNKHPDICTVSATLGRTLLKAYLHTNQSEYFDKAIAAFRVAVKCEFAPVSKRFCIAKLWAHLADSCHESALEAYRAAIELLPRLAMLGLDLESRQQALTSGSDGLARDAATCAIQSHQYIEAVELLEEGRAIFWSQALQLRTPMTALHDVAPELEERLKCISVALEGGSLRDVSKNLSDTPQKLMSMEQEAIHFNDLNKQWLATLEEVRQLDGFQDFLRPHRLSRLRDAAAHGPVVVLNASKTSCAALILTSTGVQHIPLPDLSLTEVTTLVKLVQNAITPDSNYAHVKSLVQQMPSYSETFLLRLPLERHVNRVSCNSVQSDDIFQYALGVLWVSVVEPVIHLLDLKKSDIPPRLWWCPTGPFAFLPIHAAGIYQAERMECVSDYVVSSYIPTISSLLRGSPLSADSFKMMVVIQPDTPNQKPLPATTAELANIEAHVSNEALNRLLPNKCLVRLGIPDVPALVEEVISQLPTASIAHFACHGQQNVHNPLDSALILQDGQLKVSQIMQQSMPYAVLAFLSACETAMGDKNLPDEAIHLGATLLFAGFRGVVATMWSIADNDGPKIADTFYENLFKKCHSTSQDTTQAAQALHLAVAKLRGEGASFIRWVPFIYLGR